MSLINFEEQTAPLSDYEREVLLPLFVRGLRTKIGKDQSITSKEIISALTKTGHKVNGARVRKIINHIRINGIIRNLIATSNGYHISKCPEEIARYRESLVQRASSIMALVDSFDEKIVHLNQ